MHVAMWIENPGTYARASSSRRSESRGVSAWDLRDQRAAKAISQAGDAKVTSHDAFRVHSFRLRTHRVLGRSLGGYNFYWSAPKQVFAVFAPSHSPIPHCSLRAFRLSSARFYVRTYVRRTRSAPSQRASARPLRPLAMDDSRPPAGWSAGASSSRGGPFGPDYGLGFLCGSWADQDGSFYTIKMMTDSRLSVDTLRRDGRQKNTVGLIRLEGGNVCWGTQYVLYVELRTSSGEVLKVRWVPSETRKRYFQWHRTGPAEIHYCRLGRTHDAAAQRLAATWYAGGRDSMAAPENRSRVCEVLNRFDSTKSAGSPNDKYHDLNMFDLVVDEREVPDEDGWARVVKDGVSGWVPRSYLNPLANIAPTAAPSWCPRAPHVSVVRLHMLGMTSRAPHSVCVCDCGGQSDLISSGRQIFQQLSGQRRIVEEWAIRVTKNEVMLCQFASLGPPWADRDLWYIVGKFERSDRPPSFAAGVGYNKHQYYSRALHFAMALTLAQDMPDHDIVGKTPLGFSELVRGVRESARALTTSA